MICQDGKRTSFVNCMLDIQSGHGYQIGPLHQHRCRIDEPDIWLHWSFGFVMISQSLWKRLTATGGNVWSCLVCQGWCPVHSNRTIVWGMNTARCNTELCNMCFDVFKSCWVWSFRATPQVYVCLGCWNLFWFAEPEIHKLMKRSLATG